MPPLNIDVDTFAAYSDALQAAALATTHLAATSLPADLSFHRSIDPALAHDVDVFSDRVLALASRLVHLASGKMSRLQEEEDVVDEFVRNIIDPMEGMLESTDSALDVFLGKRRDPAIHVPAVPVDPHQKKPKKQPFPRHLDPALSHASHIPKPQLSFKHVPSNTDESPYIPATLIPHKWCAKVPLGYVFRGEESNQDAKDGHEDEDDGEGRKRTTHPYYYELTHPSYPDHVFNPPVEPSLPSPLGTLRTSTTSHSLTWISTPKAFLSMANSISSVTELAVDLEHHSYRSYKGFLALMQISTRQEDFVIDLLVPEIREGLRQGKGKNVAKNDEAQVASEAGQIIARIFADPSVIKVFHGAESDVVWLQQDFNIFLVGLFDTFHASKLLEFPKHSLAYLLETYCDFTPDKRYQLADWRIRPLPAEMSAYARSDTHFLLYIYDVLRLSLIERMSSTISISNETSLPDTKEMGHGCSLILSVLARSSRTALRLYEVEVYDAESGTGSTGWDTLARKWNKFALVGSPPQMRGAAAQGPQAAVYRAIHRWRENVAREEDESTRYVLSTHHLFLLAERSPTTIPDLLSVLGGPGGVHGSLPTMLKRRTGELVAVINGIMEATNSTSNPQELMEHGRGTTGMVDSTTVEQSESFENPLATAATVTNESRLWTLPPSPTSATMISISCSSLLGVELSKERAPEKRVVSPSLVGTQSSYLATESVLFGTALSKTTSASSSGMIKSTLSYAKISDDSAERFKDLMEKIHKTLVIAPIVPMPSVVPSVKTQAMETSLSGVLVNAGMEESKTAVPETPDLVPSGPAGQIEIAFIPAHKRQMLSNQQDQDSKDDTIVVVGQASARQRKRKRDKARSTAQSSQSTSGARSGGAGTSASTGDHDLKVEEFDYSGVPNLLDDESRPDDTRSAHEEDERKKKKQRHGKGSGLFEYGNFRAPPKDQREVRNGNKTHTFR